MYRTIAAQPDLFAAYYLPMSESDVDLRAFAGTAAAFFRRLLAAVARAA